MSPAQIIEALRSEVTEDGHVLLDRLESELKISFWPEETFAAAQAAFGDSVFNRASRTYESLDRRVRHALRVWDEKYGPLSPGQEAYADIVLASCIRRGAKDARGDRGKLYAFVQSGIGRAINHERVHDGFIRRAASVDISAELAAVAA